MLLDALGGPIGAAFPKVGVAALLAEVRDRLMDELDLEYGAGVQRAVRRSLRREERVVVPEPFGVLASASVSVEGWLDGDPAGPDAAATLLDVSLALAARDGWVLVDHRPEHVLDLGGGKLGLLGTRAAARLPRERVAAFADALRGLREDDPAGLAGLGVVDNPARAHAVARAALGPLVDGPARLDQQALRGAAERAEAAGAFALAGSVTPQAQDLWPGRGLGQLAATLAAWGATEDWGTLAHQALSEG